MSEKKGFIGSVTSGDFTGAASSLNQSRKGMGLLAGVAYGFKQEGIRGALKYGAMGFFAGMVSNLVLSKNTVEGWLGNSTAPAAAKSEPIAGNTKVTTVAEKENNRARAEQHVKDEAAKNKQDALDAMAKNHTGEKPLTHDEINEELGIIKKMNNKLGIKGESVLDEATIASQPKVNADTSQEKETQVG